MLLILDSMWPPFRTLAGTSNRGPASSLALALLRSRLLLSALLSFAQRNSNTLSNTHTRAHAHPNTCTPPPWHAHIISNLYTHTSARHRAHTAKNRHRRRRQTQLAHCALRACVVCERVCDLLLLLLPLHFPRTVELRPRHSKAHTITHTRPPRLQCVVRSSTSPFNLTPFPENCRRQTPPDAACSALSTCFGPTTGGTGQ